MGRFTTQLVNLAGQVASLGTEHFLPRVFRSSRWPLLDRKRSRNVPEMASEGLTGNSQVINYSEAPLASPSHPHNESQARSGHHYVPPRTNGARKERERRHDHKGTSPEPRGAGMR